MKKVILTLCLLLTSLLIFPQNFGNYPLIKKEQLLLDFELLKQGLEKYHSGMYWYTPKDSTDLAFQRAKEQISKDMNVLEFHKIIAPIVGLTREDHTDIYLPESVNEQIKSRSTFFPFKVIFLGQELYLTQNGTSKHLNIEGKAIASINGETPVQIIEKIGSLFASDGYIKTVKYSDLEGFAFSHYYYLFYGLVNEFEVQFKDGSPAITVQAHYRDEIKANMTKHNTPAVSWLEKDVLEFKLMNLSIAYMGIHSFSNDAIKEGKHKNLKSFLKSSFRILKEKNIPALIIDVSENGGGNEGNEGLVYSYLGTNYQKYKKVRAKAQTAILDNGKDTPVEIKTFGWLERIFFNRKMEDGSYERKRKAIPGLMAYRKEPKYKFDGKLYVIISPVTYSGGSEFANMVFTNKRGVFVGQETGGGFYGNTSGYSYELTLPHSKISVDLPALQFVMNVSGLPLGSGVIPHYRVIPTYEQYKNKENAPLDFILNLESKQSATSSK